MEDHPQAFRFSTDDRTGEDGWTCRSMEDVELLKDAYYTLRGLNELRKLLRPLPSP